MGPRRAMVIAAAAIVWGMIVGLLLAVAIYQADRVAAPVADELPGGVPAGRRDGVRCVRRPPAPITYPVRAPVRRAGDCP